MSRPRPEPVQVIKTRRDGALERQGASVTWLFAAGGTHHTGVLFVALCGHECRPGGAPLGVGHAVPVVLLEDVFEAVCLPCLDSGVVLVVWRAELVECPHANPLLDSLTRAYKGQGEIEN